jgi:hypothetical protein
MSGETYILREGAERDAGVRVVRREGGYVYFRRLADTSNTPPERLDEGEFQRRYVDEDELRLLES